MDPNGNPVVQTAPDTGSFHVRGFGFAPFVSSNGTWNNPFTTTTVTTTLLTKTASAGTTVSTTSDGITTKSVVINKNGTITTTTQKTSTDTLRFGTDFQAEVYSPGPAFDNFFYASPFYQTDYRDTAQIGGVDLIYEPLVAPPPGAPILGINEGYIDKTFSYLTQFSAEAELTDVSNPGYTALAKGRHAWIGETVRPNLTLFPGGPAQYPAQYDDDWFNKWVAGRIPLIGTQQFYWDADTGKTATYYSAVLQYKLGACTVKAKPDPDRPCATSGSSAISLEYDTGRNKDSYLKTNQWLVKLSFSY